MNKEDQGEENFGEKKIKNENNNNNNNNNNNTSITFNGTAFPSTLEAAKFQ